MDFFFFSRNEGIIVYVPKGLLQLFKVGSSSGSPKIKVCIFWLFCIFVELNIDLIKFIKLELERGNQ